MANIIALDSAFCHTNLRFIIKDIRMFSKFFMWFFLFLVLTSCRKEELPVVVTSTPVVTNGILVMKGEVLSGGGSTRRGFVWAMHPLPTDADNVLMDSRTGKGAFSLNVSNVTPTLKYYLRAFAENSFGRGYGDVQEITVPSNLIIVNSFIIDTPSNCDAGFANNHATGRINFRNDSNLNAVHIYFRNSSDSRRLIIKKGLTWSDYSIVGDNIFNHSIITEVNNTLTLNYSISVPPSLTNTFYTLPNIVSVGLVHYNDIVNLLGRTLLDTSAHQVHFLPMNILDNTDFYASSTIVDSTKSFTLDFHNSLVDSTLDRIEVSWQRWNSVQGIYQYQGSAVYALDSNDSLYRVFGSGFPSYPVISNFGNNRYRLYWNSPGSGLVFGEITASLYVCGNRRLFSQPWYRFIN